MYKIKAFSNASEFQEIFGIQEHGNGVKSRRNKILLQLYKSKSMWNYCNAGWGRFETFFSIRSMATLRQRVIEQIQVELMTMQSDFGGRYPVRLMNMLFWSSQFATDENNGLPSNGNVGFVRYVSHEKNRDGKIYRMRSGRFYKRLLLESELGRALPEQVLNWLCEQFTEQWSSYVMQRLPHFTLHVDDRFDRIYKYDVTHKGDKCCTYDFNSCMMGDDQWIFYRDCVDARAAYLENDEGYIIARCVIFNNVKDEDGKTWRLAERQYSEEGRDLYKRCLVDSLVEGGYIDGYKQVGVDCHATNSYVDKDGNSLQHKMFSIECNLEFSRDSDEAWDSDSNHILSYQDSFKYFDTQNKMAYNTEPSDMSNIRMLDTTTPYLEGYWDEYHECWCNNFYWVWRGGKEIRCDINRLEDFVKYANGYFHKDEFVKCSRCDNMFPDPKLYAHLHIIPEFKGEYFCSSKCRNEYQDWYEHNVCFYDQLSSCWIEKDKDNMVKLLYLAWDEVEMLTTSASKLKQYIDNRQVFIIDKKEIGLEKNIPMFSAGLIRPAIRFESYFKKYTPRVVAKAKQILEINSANNVDYIYNEV